MKRYFKITLNSLGRFASFDFECNGFFSEKEVIDRIKQEANENWIITNWQEMNKEEFEIFKRK